MQKPVMLLILDGWGYRANVTPDNAIEQGHTPNWHNLLATCPHVLWKRPDMMSDCRKDKWEIRKSGTRIWARDASLCRICRKSTWQSKTEAWRRIRHLSS